MAQELSLSDYIGSIIETRKRDRMAKYQQLMPYFETIYNKKLQEEANVKSFGIVYDMMKAKNPSFGDGYDKDSWIKQISSKYPDADTYLRVKNEIDDANFLKEIQSGNYDVIARTPTQLNMLRSLKKERETRQKDTQYYNSLKNILDAKSEEDVKKAFNEAPEDIRLLKSYYDIMSTFGEAKQQEALNLSINAINKSNDVDALLKLKEETTNSDIAKTIDSRIKTIDKAEKERVDAVAKFKSAIDILNVADSKVLGEITVDTPISIKILDELDARIDKISNDKFTSISALDAYIMSEYGESGRNFTGAKKKEYLRKLIADTRNAYNSYSRTLGIEEVADKEDISLERIDMAIEEFGLE